MKHTKGPWRCTKYPGIFSINSAGGRQIAIMTEHHGDTPLTPVHQFERSEQDKADADLISAAPELLEALELILKDFDGDWKHYEQAKRAVSKARGEGES